MKELTIRIRFDDAGNKIGTIVEKIGFGKNISDLLEIIGLLENVKTLEMEKLRKLSSATIDHGI